MGLFSKGKSDAVSNASVGPVMGLNGPVGVCSKCGKEFKTIGMINKRCDKCGGVIKRKSNLIENVY